MILFWAGAQVLGWFISNVSSDGIGSLSSAMRDACIASHMVFVPHGLGAFCRSANAGCRASCNTCVTSDHVDCRCLLVHSMCRWGVFPL